MHTIENELLTIKNDMQARGITTETIRIYLKEVLQDYVLDYIYNYSKYTDLVFYGGTALRKLYSLNRVSEDLDFEWDGEIDLDKLNNGILSYFHQDLAYKNITSSVQINNNINRVTLKFELLHTLDLSSHIGEKLHLKIEINSIGKIIDKPIKTPYLKRNLSTIINHYTIETLMASKIIACLSRIYEKGTTGVQVKGRDYYDLIWYMQKSIKPNQNVFFQKDNGWTLSHVMQMLDDKVTLIKSEDLLIDLEPFFENKDFIRNWCINFHEFYMRYSEYLRE